MRGEISGFCLLGVLDLRCHQDREVQFSKMGKTMQFLFSRESLDSEGAFVPSESTTVSFSVFMGWVSTGG